MKKNLLFAILCVLGLFGTLNAQVVTIDGTVGSREVTTSKNVPAFCANKWAITQQFYTAEEIGKSSGTIESIAFKTADVSAEAEKYPFTRNLEIYMSNSDDYAIVGNSFRAMSASELVFSGEVEFAYNAWVSIDITDFEYTGKNVLICVNDVTGSNVSGGITFDAFKHSVTIDGSNANRALYKRSTSSAFNATTTVAGATVNAPVPFVQFAFAAGTTEEYTDPVVPTNLVATVLSESKVQLTWEGDANNLSYNIYQGTDVIANVTETSYAVKNLVPGEYYFSVTAANGPKESEAISATATIVAKTVESITVGSTGDGDSFTAPMSLLNPGEPANLDSWVEQLYTAAEMGGARTIERLAFPIKSTISGATPITTKEIKIYLAETTATDYANKAWTATEDLKLVYSDTDIIIGDQEWETFEFTAPFNYSGEKNLAVVVAKSSEESTGMYLWHTNSVENSVLYTNETSSYPTEQGNATKTRPVVRFAWAVEEEPVVPEPTAPAAPVVTATATSESTIVLAWEAVEGATSYNVYAEELVANVTELTYTVEGLTPATEYCYTVKAVNEVGESEASEKACATTEEAEEEPIVPEIPEIEAGDFQTAFYYDFENGKLTGWNIIDANSDGVKWQFKDGMDGGVNDGKGLYSGMAGGDKADDYIITASKCSLTTTSEFSFTFVPYDYYWCGEKIALVVSEDGEAFETVWSYEFSSETYDGKWQEATIDLSAYAGKDLYLGLRHYGTEDGIRVDNLKLYSEEPGVPSNFTATAAPTTVTLTWDAVYGAKSYNVYAATTEVVEEVETTVYTLVKEGVKETTFVVEGLSYETEYSYSVTSVNEFKESRYAKVVTVTTLGEPLPEGVELLFKETFDTYEAGQYIAKDGAAHWTTWSKKPGSAEDGVVAEADGNKYGRLTYGNDQVLLLGDYKAGEFDLEFDMYIPDGKCAYYNILHDFNGGNSSWALQAYLQMTDDGQGNQSIAPGHGAIHAGGSNIADIPCVYDGWMHFRVHINANIDKAEYYYTMPNGTEVKAFEWQWSKDSFGESVSGRSLDAMNFFPPSTSSEYYIDNLMLKRIGGESAAIVTISEEAIEGSMNVDDINTVEFEVENIGNAIAEYVAWIDYGKGQLSSTSQPITYAVDIETLSNAKPIGWPIEEGTLTYEIAALYPSTVYSNSLMGTYITDAAYFLGTFVNSESGDTIPALEPGTDMIFRIYAQGLNGIPGEVLAEKVVPAKDIVLDWNVVTFDEPVALTGFDFYIAVEMTQCVNGFPLVLDGNNKDAQEGYSDLFRSSNGAFKSLTEYTTGGEKFGSWYILLNCSGDPIQGGWAELDKKSGEIAIGAKETISVEFSTFGLKKGETYEASLIFQTNTELGELELPVSLYVWGEDVEEILSNTYNIYPNPTKAQVTVEGENINYIAVYNSVGQLVKVVKTQANVVDMSAYENGVYFFNIVDNAGQSSVQRVVVAK